MSLSKRWAWTVNNPGDWTPVWQPAKMDYMVWQREVGEQGTEHIQGYFRLIARSRLETAKRLLTETAHLEVAKGTEAQNKEYCSKETTRKEGTEFTECGTFEADAGKQGKRTDLEGAVAKIQAGVPLATIIQEDPGVVRYINQMQQARQVLRPAPPTERDVHTVVLWGASGTGKSHRCWKKFPNLYAVPHGRNPWDLYEGQETILMDEFEPGQWTIADLNRYLDKWPCQLQCRYFNRSAAWTRVLICSNWDPTTWFLAELPAVRAALFRRLQAPMGEIIEVQGREQVIEGLETEEQLQ